MTRVMAELIDGKALAARVRAKVKDRIGSQNLNPGLAILLVGTDPASHTYVQKKQEACAEAGIHFEKFFYPEFVRDDELISKIQELNQRAVIHGILVQLPLPAGHDTDKIIAQIDPKKDVDGFHPENLERLKNGKPAMVSAVALAVMKLVDEAMKKTTAISGSHFKPHLIRTMVNEITFYPVGTMVKLSTDDIGKVVKVNRGSPLAPVVEIIIDSDGKKLPEPRQVNLAEETITHVKSSIDPNQIFKVKRSA